MWTLGLAIMAIASVSSCYAQRYEGPRGSPPIVFTQSISVQGCTVQIDFAKGLLDLPYSEIAQRIQVAAHAVVVYYGKFPVPRARILVIPVADRHGVLQGTTWGDSAGFPAFVRLRIGQATTPDELAADWVITHELVHTALPSLPDDQHWLEEGIASYVEPIARAQAGQLSVAKVWAGMVSGMPNGEPEASDKGLDRTHTWGRTYWGGAMFCLMADIDIRRQTGNRYGLQDALRAIVASGGSIDKDWPLSDILAIGDRATNTHVLETMYAQWSVAPVPVDLISLWDELGVHDKQGEVTFDMSAPFEKIRVSITAPNR